MREFEYEPSPGMPNRTFLGVFSWNELNSPSVIKGMTELEYIDFFEREEYGAQGVFLNNNGHMPQEAHEHNELLREQGEEPGPYSDYQIAVYSRRPPTS